MMCSLTVHPVTEDPHKDGFMALGLSTSTFLFDNRDRYHGVVLTMQVPQIHLSTARWTFLFGNRDRYHGISHEWRCLSFSSSTVWRCLATETVHASAHKTSCRKSSVRKWRKCTFFALVAVLLVLSVEVCPTGTSPKADC